MKKFEEKAIPLIFRNQDKKYEINPDAIRFFQSIQGKIAVISVAGMYRTGKSYLLNTILLKQKAGFAVGPTTNPKTKGIWVWGKPLILKNEKDEIINVCVVDSQGLGSIEEDINHDLRLFSLTLLISSMFIYNTLGAIDEHAIDSLGLVLRLCQRLKSESYNDLPDFYWVLRDFSLALVGRDNQPLSTKQYLEQSLSPQPGDSQVRNKIRQSIRASFPQRSCFTFVRPLTNEEQLQKLDTLQIDQLRPEFMEQVIEFRRLINGSIRTKKIKGKEISAEMLIQLIKVYTAEINGEELPQIETGWKYVCERECEQAMDTVEKQADEIINKIMNSLPVTKKEFSEKREAVYESLKTMFESRTTGNDQALLFLPELTKMVDRKMGKVEDEMKLKNTQETKLYIKKQFENNVEKRLKAGEFKSMGQLAKQFQVFYQFYRKKCPYKDEIQVGLQCLLKRFSDCSVLFHKGFKTRKDQQIAKLREEMDRIVHQFQLKQERFKHQKTATADKMAVLQSKIQQINRQNKELSELLMKSEVDLEKQKRQHEEGASQANQQVELEIIEMRKKLMNAQELVREAECIKNCQINNFRNQLLLKQNQITNINEERNSLKSKLATLTNELMNEKDERERKIQELINSSDTYQNQWQSVRKNLEQKLKNSDQLVLRLESSLQTKASELIALNQQHEKNLKQLQQSYGSQKVKFAEQSQNQVRTLKQTIQSQQQATILKVRKLEAQYSQKQMQLRMHRLEMDQQLAILNQKLEFVRKQCSQKQQKIAKLQEQNTCYLNMFEEKDNEMVNLSAMLDESKITYQSYQSETTQKIEQLNLSLQQKRKDINKFQQLQQRLSNELREKNQQIKQLNQKIKMQQKTSEQKLKQINEKLSWSQEQSQKLRIELEEQIEVLRIQNSKMTDDQKRTAELSLVQLKNYYQMQRQRLQKRNLQDRKKHQNSEAALTTQLEGKHRKALRSLQEELNAYKMAKEQLEENIARSQNDYEQRLASAEEEKQSERKRLQNKNELIQKKYEELQLQFEQFQRNYEEERIVFVKKMESLNFDLSRKEKQLMQLNSKKQSLEQTLVKKETQVDSVKKMMNQEIESSLKRVSQIQQKYQKLNEQYMQYRIATEQELALTKQKNEFQTNKLNQLTKEKETGSNKTIERLDKQRFGDLKDQNQKLKAEILALQGRLQTQRKTSREQQSLAKKQFATIERDFQFLQQKQSISQAKVSELEAKLIQKNENFIKQLEDQRARMATERQNLQKQIDQLKQKLSNSEDEKNQANWTLQKDIALLNEKIKYAEYQRDQAKKQLQQNEKRLSLATAQLRKASEKASEDSETRKQLSDKKYTGQIQQYKEALRTKCDEYEDIIRKHKEQLRISKDKNAELIEKIQNLERVRSADRSLQEQNQNLRREKEALTATHRADRQKQLDEWKRKIGELQRKNKELEKKTMEQFFQSEKDTSKWAMEKQNLQQKIKGLQDTLEWERNKTLAKSKIDMKKSESSTHFNLTEYSKHSTWK